MKLWSIGPLRRPSFYKYLSFLVGVLIFVVLGFILALFCPILAAGTSLRGNAPYLVPDFYIKLLEVSV